MTIETLLPCPFCNGEASLSIGRNGHGVALDYVECIDCAASSGMFTSREAVKAWNRRSNNNG